MNTVEPVKVALLGCGVVGAQVARVLTTRRDELAARVGRPLELVGIAVRDATKPRPGIDPAWLTDDAMALAARPDVDIVIELIGGIDTAEQLLRVAMGHGAAVVTANKALLGARAGELFAAADAAGVDLYFEAAVAGAIPIIRPLRESLVGDQITTVMGIVNGTTNFILDKMTTDAMDFTSALALAQQAGYAEADPTADIDGFDAAAKAAILARLAFHTPVSADQVYREGIAALTQDDIKAAAEADCVLKLLAIARMLPSGEVSVRVHPAMVPQDHPLASVHGAYNAVFVLASQAGRLMFLGPGAGGAPTASAVIGDLVTVARNRDRGIAVSSDAFQASHSVAPIGEAMTSYHLRFRVVDEAGVLATVANIFAGHQVSVATLRQQRPLDAGEHSQYAAELHIQTHLAREADLAACVADLAASPVVGEAPRRLRMEGL